MHHESHDLDLLKASLAGEPYEIFTATSGQEALSILGTRYPAHPGKISVGLAVLKAERALKGKTTEDFSAQGKWEDLEKWAEFSLLATAAPPAFMTNQEYLYVYYITKMVQIETTSTGPQPTGDSLSLFAFVRLIALGNIKPSVTC